MRYGFVLPLPDARATVEQAVLAEEAGWDGIFVWEPVWGVEAWVTLGAAAVRTQRIRLGTMISPLSRMRPWKLAGETATVDQLSNGRVILSVGLGAPETGFAAFGEVTDRKTRAELLDEGLDIVTGLWQGQPFRYDGKHYTIRPTDFMPAPPPVQQPRIPIWVVGAWPRPKSLARALRYDGILPAGFDAEGKPRNATLEEVRELSAYIAEHRPPEQRRQSFDIVVEGATPGEDKAQAAAIVQPWLDAGATWWIEADWTVMDKADAHERIAARLRQGPPRV